MPSNLSGKVALVTGSNTGIGRVTAAELARAGAHVFMACRSATKPQPVAAGGARRAARVTSPRQGRRGCVVGPPASAVQLTEDLCEET